MRKTIQQLFTPFFVERTSNHPTVHLYKFHIILPRPIIHPPVCQKGGLGAHHPAGAFFFGLFVKAKKFEKGHLLKCPFGVVRESQKAWKRTLVEMSFWGCSWGLKKLKKDTCWSVLLGFVRAKKLEKGHLLKCPFGVVRESQKAWKRTLVEVSFWGCSWGLKSLKKDTCWSVLLGFVKAKKLEKGHLLKCPFGVVREGQKA